MIHIHKNYDEMAIKNVYKLVKDNKKIRPYLPTNCMDLGRFPDRKWFWNICNTTIPQWTTEFYS